MKVCILSRSLPCHLQGGMEHHTITLAKELVKNGCQVNILTTQHENNHPCNETYANIEIIHLPNTLPAKYNFAYFKNSLRHVNADTSIDLIHSQGFAAFGCMFRKKRPLVTSIHGTLTSETNLFYKYSYENLWNYRKRLAVKPLYHQLINTSDAILADSEFSKGLLSSEFPHLHKKIHKVMLGIDTEYFKFIDKTEAKKQLNLTEQFTLLALGRLTQSKGYQVIIQALTYLNDLPISLLIAGEGPYRDTLESDVQARQLKNVTFLGKVEENNKSILYSAADIFINPDLTAPAFGLVSTEAMACGIPVIASHTGSLPEILSPDTGFLFPRGDAQQLAILIRMLYNEPTLRKYMGSNARVRTVSLFDAKRMTKEVEDVYKKVLGQTR